MHKYVLCVNYIKYIAHSTIIFIKYISQNNLKIITRSPWEALGALFSTQRMSYNFERDLLCTSYSPKRPIPPDRHNFILQVWLQWRVQVTTFYLKELHGWYFPSSFSWLYLLGFQPNPFLNTAITQVSHSTAHCGLAIAF